MRPVVLAAALCVLLAMPLLATIDNPVEAVGQQPTNMFNTRTITYPTVDGEPLFSLHICVAQGSDVAIGVGEIISESLGDIGIEGVVHPLPWYPILRGLYPEDFGVTQYGFERPCPAGPPDLVTVYDPPLEIIVMQSYDLAFHGINFEEIYGGNGFSIGHSDSTYNQGYSNSVYDDLWDELDALPIEWDANFPLWPDLNTADGARALEILRDLQIIWDEEQPRLILHNRMSWEGDGTTGFSLVLENFNNEHLAKPAVRQAINLALRRQDVLDLYGYEPPWETYKVDTWLAPWHPGFNDVSHAEYDILAARQLLYEAGYTSVLVPDSIADTVEAYVNSGVLESEVGNALTIKLERAIDLINRDNYRAALQTLIAFINQVNALITSEQLPVEEGQELIALAQEIIDSLVAT